MKLAQALCLLTILAVAIVVTGCGGRSTPKSTGQATNQTSVVQIKYHAANAETKIIIGSKNFTEQKILGEVYAQALSAAGYKVEKALNLGDEHTALNAVETGLISGYPEYTGTALLSFFQIGGDRIPRDPKRAHQLAQRHFAKRGIVALPPTPFANGDGLAVNASTARELKLTNLSNLAQHSEKMTFFAMTECRQRLDCIPGLKRTYDIQFKRFVPIDPALRHETLKGKKLAVSRVFSTDPQIESRKLVVLKDDKQMFPPYNSTFVIKQSTLDRAGPDLPRTITLVNSGLNMATMRELNARVDLDKETPAEVGRAYLRETGYLAS